MGAFVLGSSSSSSSLEKVGRLSKLPPPLFLTRLGALPLPVLLRDPPLALSIVNDATTMANTRPHLTTRESMSDCRTDVIRSIVAWPPMAGSDRTPSRSGAPRSWNLSLTSDTPARLFLSAPSLPLHLSHPFYCTSTANGRLAAVHPRAPSTHPGSLSQANPFHSPALGRPRCGDRLHPLPLLPIPLGGYHQPRPSAAAYITRRAPSTHAAARRAARGTSAK